jgi:hypothetical protein
MAWVIIKKENRKVHGTSLGIEKPVKNAKLFDVVWMDTEPPVDSSVALADKRIKASPIETLSNRVSKVESDLKAGIG